MTARFSTLSAQVVALGTGALLGIAAIVALGGMIFGSQVHASGGNVLTITTGAGARPLTTADVDAIARSVPDIVALSRAVFGTAPVGGSTLPGSGVAQTHIQGVDPSFTQVTSDMVGQGTWFTAQDATSANRVAVLGHTLSSRLFQNPQTAIGATIRIRNVPYTVIGVLSAQTGVAGDNPDDAVLIPFQTGQVRLFGATALDAVLVQVADAKQTDAVMQQVVELLRQRHQVREGQPDGFTVRATSRPAVGDGWTAAQFLGQAVHLAWQSSCQAKGLCARGSG